MTESVKEKRIAGIVLTTILLTGLTIVSSYRGASYASKAQTDIAAAANRGDTFLTDSIKEHSYRLQMEVFELSKLMGRGNPDVEKFLEKKVKEYDDEIARFEKEKKQIAEDNEKLIREQAEYRKHYAAFSFAVVFLQAAILISSLGAFAGKRALWYAGICCGVFGFFCTVNGFFLWF